MNVDDPTLMPAEAAAAPPSRTATLLSPAEVPACSVCGRQDETLRAVVYPFVFSLLIVTFRRALAGVWCRTHRNLRLALASTITATAGWFGIPFGFFFTPLALLKLAQGGQQPADLNADMLRDVAALKLQEGDGPAAVRCLEASLRYRDTPTVRASLHHVRRQYDLPVERLGCLPSALVLAATLLAAGGIGALVGLLDWLVTWLLSSAMGETGSILLVILSWIPMVALAYGGGLVLFQVIAWALAEICCRRVALAAGLAVAAALLAVYSILQGAAMADTVHYLVAGEGFASALDAILGVLMVLLAGGALWFLGRLPPAMTSDVIYLILLLIITIYYAGLGLWTANQTRRWQQRLSAPD